MEESEKSFLELWSKAFPRIPKNRFNTLVALSGLLLGLFPICFGPIVNFGKDWSELAALMVQVFAGLLGFIIAGYTIFVTSANPGFVVAFWRHTDPKSQYPLLKLHLIVYMRLFLSIFSGTIFFAGLVVSYKVWSLLRDDLILSARLLICLQAIVAGLTGWRLTSAAIQIKAMIFNLYDLTITQACYLDLMDKQSKE